MTQKSPTANTPTAGSIDRKSYEPAYAQLVRLLREQIASGEFRPRSQLPSEAQLCDHYQVSPMTVRRAVNVLIDQGLVITSKGRGTFVKPMELWEGTFQLQELRDLFKDAKSTQIKLLEVHIASASDETAAKLAVEPGARTVYIRRLLSEGDRPVLYHVEHLVYDPLRPTVEAEMEVTSLHGLFLGTGETDLKRGSLAIESAVINQQEAELLCVEAGSPAFRLEHVFHDFEDNPVSWGWFVVPGDRLRFRAQVGISDEHRGG